jgi:hypothetical protein
MERDDDLPLDAEWALAEVREGLRQVVAASGHGSVTLFVQYGEAVRVGWECSKKKPA